VTHKKGVLNSKIKIWASGVSKNNGGVGVKGLGEGEQSKFINLTKNINNLERRDRKQRYAK
jgi:hypothetical protein